MRSILKKTLQFLSALAVTAAFLTSQNVLAEGGSVEDFIQSSKKPTSWFSWGSDFRARWEYMDNALSLSPDTSKGGYNLLHEQSYFRFRGRLNAAITPMTNVTIRGQLTAEPRLWMRPSGFTQYRGRSGMEWRYGIVDTLNMKLSNMFDQPMDFTVGRQDIMIGDVMDWWLVADGTPLDGSWTMFMDAARLTYNVESIKTRFDVSVVSAKADPGDTIPTVGDSVSSTGSQYYLTEQDEIGAIVYVSNKSIQNTTLDGFFIYKGDDPVPGMRGDNADIYTIGGQVKGNVGENWEYKVQGAYQFGNKKDPTLGAIYGGGKTIDIRAWGVDSRLTYKLNDKMKNQGFIYCEALSGDDPDSTGTDEMFDILWGRWPRYSELYIFSYVMETGGKIAQHNNLIRPGVGWSLSPLKNLNCTLTYSPMFALEKTPTRTVNPALFSYDGTFRGHYARILLKYKYNQHLSGAFWGEWVWQGDYYNQRELMSFVRAEITLTY